MIKIKNLKVKVTSTDKEILKGISLEFEIGKNYCLLGKNGSGKSTLSNFLMGHPNYEYLDGKVDLDGTNLLNLSPDQRSNKGLFLSFQNIPEIKGIKLIQYLRTIYNISLKNKGDLEISPFIFKRFIKKYLIELNIDEKFLNRDLNVGFSGGEKRKIEILQMKLIGPKYIIFDEIDSGLDLDSFKIIAEILKNFSTKYNSFIIITHYFNIFKYIDIDKVYVIKEGIIIKEGGIDLIDKIKKKGFIGL